MNTEELEQKLRFFTENEKGDPEAALFFYAGMEKPWKLEVGNMGACVSLGEVSGEMTFDGFSLEDVIGQAEAHYVSKAEGRAPRTKACLDFWRSGWARKWKAQCLDPLTRDPINRDYPRLAYIHHRLLQTKLP